MTKDEALKLARTALGVQLDALLGKAGHLRNDDRRRYAENGIKAIDEALAQPEHDYKDLYEKEKRKSAMWLAKYEEIAGPAPKAIPMAQPEQKPVGKLQEATAERAWFTIAELNAWADKKLSENPHWVMPKDEPERDEPPPQRKPLTPDNIRKTGGIVHGDGNIFFTNINQLNTAIRAREQE